MRKIVKIELEVGVNLQEDETEQEMFDRVADEVLEALKEAEIDAGLTVVGIGHE